MESLLLMVLSVICSVPALWMPPPLTTERLPVIVLLVQLSLAFQVLAHCRLDAAATQQQVSALRLTLASWRAVVAVALPVWLGAAAVFVFIALHVPLFMAMLWLHFHHRPRVRDISRMVLAVFLVVHAGLHLRLSGHPLYSFDSPLSMALIYGGGVAGLLYSVVAMRHWR